MECARDQTYFQGMISRVLRRISLLAQSDKNFYSGLFARVSSTFDENCRDGNRTHAWPVCVIHMPPVGFGCFFLRQKSLWDTGKGLSPFAASKADYDS